MNICREVIIWHGQCSVRPAAAKAPFGKSLKFFDALYHCPAPCQTQWPWQPVIAGAAEAALWVSLQE